MLVYIIVIALIFLVSLIAFLVINNKGREIKNRKLVLFICLFGIIISACGFLGKVPGASESILYFFLLQAVFLALGYLCCFMLKKNAWGVFENEHTSKALFTLINASIGMIGFTLVFNYCSDGGPAAIYSMSVITFVLPQFLVICFEAYARIPHEIRKVWYFPVGEDDIDTDNIDTSVMYMIEVEYTMSNTDDRIINTKIRAPLGLKFGDWFKLYVENYNSKHDEDPIHTTYKDSMPQGWIFYVKPSLLRSPRYIDIDLTIRDNKLQEKNVVIARRVGTA